MALLGFRTNQMPFSGGREERSKFHLSAWRCATLPRFRENPVNYYNVEQRNQSHHTSNQIPFLPSIRRIEGGRGCSVKMGREVVERGGTEGKGVDTHSCVEERGGMNTG